MYKCSPERWTPKHLLNFFDTAFIFDPTRRHLVKSFLCCIKMNRDVIWMNRNSLQIRLWLQRTDSEALAVVRKQPSDLRWNGALVRSLPPYQMNSPKNAEDVLPKLVKTIVVFSRHFLHAMFLNQNYHRGQTALLFRGENNLRFHTLAIPSLFIFC